MIEKMTYSVKEAAEALNVSRSLLYRQVENGTCEIPYCKIGSRILFPIKAVEEYFSGCSKKN